MMSTRRFDFKQFSLTDQHCGMKIGTDGVILGAWTTCKQATRILDIGCGCGLIALMLAQRSEAEIVALDIDEGAIADCSENVSKSPWNERIKPVHCDIRDYRPDRQFDLIVSNPPFFTETLQSPDPRRAKARHESGLSIDTLVSFANKYLSDNGTLSIIVPNDREVEVCYEAMMQKLYIRRSLRVASKHAKPFSRMLFDIRKVDGPISRAELFIHEDTGEYSPQYIKLTKDYYLNL